MRQVAGGGGGYGDPCLRPVEKVAKEVRNGTLSIMKAKEDYGVVVDRETLEIDRAKTQQLRSDRNI